MIIGSTNAIAILWRESPVLFKVKSEKRKLEAEGKERIFKASPRKRIFRGDEE